MIILAVDRQAEIFILSLLMGVCGGFFYDCINILRLIVPHKKIISSLEDGIYWIICIYGVFNIMLNNNSGEIRLFSVMAFFGALILYNATISKVIMSVSEKIVNIIKFIVRLFLEIILTPFRILWIIFKRPVKFVNNNIKKTRTRLLILIKKYVKIYVITLRERLRLILK